MSEYLNFVEQPPDNRKTKMWFVYSKSESTGGAPLAVISFRPQWRKYISVFGSHAVFDDSCLQAMVDFQKTQTALWREEVKNRHAGANALAGEAE